MALRIRKKNQDVERAEEKTYTPGEVCDMFDLARTTLFRWEELDEIPRAIRDDKDRRTYRWEHLQSIARLVRRKIGEDINTPSRYSADQEYPPPQLAEQLYRLEFIMEKDPCRALRMLSALSEKHRFSKVTLDLLLDKVRERPSGDPVRQKILELLMQQEKMATTPDK